MIRSLSALTLVAFGLLATGCYNTYVVKPEEFAKLQSKPENDAIFTVNDDGGTPVAIEEDTKLFVVSKGGRRYPVSAFNFRMTNSQLVASDRDTLLMLDGVDTYEVDHLSTWKTVTLASVGALAAAGVIVAIIVTAGTKSYE